MLLRKDSSYKYKTKHKYKNEPPHEENKYGRRQVGKQSLDSPLRRDGMPPRPSEGGGVGCRNGGGRAR